MSDEIIMLNLTVVLNPRYLSTGNFFGQVRIKMLLFSFHEASG